MALSEIEIAKIQVDYTAGKLSKTGIAQKHRISRNTLAKYARDNDWKYGRDAQKLSDIIEEKTYERLIKDEVDRATKITDNFLGDIERYRKLALIPSSELAEAYNDAKLKGTKISQKEFSRIYQLTKVLKTAIEALNIGYAGSRKALGMDREEEKRKRLPKHDPVEGMTEDEIDSRLEEMDD